jgi:ATP-dependent DNA helicase RecG
VLDEIGADLRSPHPMNRLLQGDVGSGKTIVAVLAMLVAAENGYQAALMAPTEILAEQHATRLGELLAGRGDRTAVLTSGAAAAERRAARKAVASGEARLIVGTHALLDEGVGFEKLGLAVIDEQHRFGVVQRAALVAKGLRPDVLVMTATPIPRTLALTVYGDLDVSVIDEKPPGRQPVETVVRTESEREKVFEALELALDRGRQAYVIYPLVEESRKSDLRAATEAAAALAKRFGGRRVALLTGRMKAEEKTKVMEDFAAGRTDVLVATTVVEVGVDVANASVMIVEHAERFGLSQLHQLRGRVGRGRQRSYCVLACGEEITDAARVRLETMAETDDGFRIAEADLELRGPGELLGTAQHGVPDLRVGSLARDQIVMEEARREAFELVRTGGRSLDALVARLDTRVKERFSLLDAG